MAGLVNETVVRVRYAETDAMGVAYHGNYFAWFEVGRTEYLRRLGMAYTTVEALGLHLPVVECRARFISPVRYDDEIVIAATVTRLDRLRIHYGYDLRERQTGRALATGETYHVFVNREGRPTRLPVDSDLWQRLRRVQP